MLFIPKFGSETETKRCPWHLFEYDLELLSYLGFATKPLQ